MPQFRSVAPEEVVVGGGRHAQKAKAERQVLRQFMDALESSNAGIIYLDEGDDPDMIKKFLRLAGHATGIGFRSSWDNPDNPTLLAWKRHKSDMMAA